MSKEYEKVVSRDCDAVKCLCGGYAERVDCTEEEIKEYGCGRRHECCSRAFVCVICNERWVGTANAP